MMKDVYDLNIIKDLKKTVFEVFNEIRLTSAGMGTFGMPESKWEFLQEKYYEKIKEAFLLEQEKYKQSFREKVPIQ